jgi:hypothetical protein
MSFLYPHSIDVRRSNDTRSGSPNIGLLGYSGVTQGIASGASGEKLIASGLSCSIQATGMGRVKGQGLLPADAPGPGQWHVYVPLGAVSRGAIKDRDVLIDDEGYRYLVSQAQWDSLGYKIVCIRLET